MFDIWVFVSQHVPVFLDIIPVLETLDIIPLDIIPDRLLDLFIYYSLDTVLGPRTNGRFSVCNSSLVHCHPRISSGSSYYVHFCFHCSCA